MIFNDHSRLAGQHAFLSASKYHWIRYNDQKLEASFRSSMAARRGSELHAFACEAIRLGIRLPKNNKTINAYVNDALGFRMDPEVTLYFSENCFGTTDAISFRNNQLRIHDLKTGITSSSFDQLSIYAALFCLEYKVKPMDIVMEFRIYQNDDVRIEPGDPDYVTHIMSKIIAFDKFINELKMEALG